ncbi:unnamed protein product [Arabis nemorensis]|uniref:Uncharacterized protein n=1 Tax=Arabis nemorensis TaxID=586526 RepID=A0A565CR32_9BRAS|nr:unnamed protein product [Arabis nemorensis]
MEVMVSHLVSRVGARVEPALEIIGLTLTLGFERSILARLISSGLVLEVVTDTVICQTGRARMLGIGIGGLEIAETNRYP